MNKLDLTYVNSQGTAIELNRWPYLIQSHDLFDYHWDYYVTQMPNGNGGRVNMFAKQLQERTITLGIRGPRGALAGRLHDLFIATEIDIATEKPGRLMIGDQYMICYMAVDSSVVAFRHRADFMVKELKVIAEIPFWFSEELINFFASTPEISEFGKRYDGRYAYQYSTGYANSTLFNSHYVATPIILTIYGPCTDPAIYINNILYGVRSSAAANERIIIDQIQRRIYKIMADGTELNLFDYRYKEYDQFGPIPAGSYPVVFSGNYAFSVTLLKQRSEPEWT